MVPPPASLACLMLACAACTCRRRPPTCHPHTACPAPQAANKATLTALGCYDVNNPGTPILSLLNHMPLLPLQAANKTALTALGCYDVNKPHVPTQVALPMICLDDSTGAARSLVVVRLVRLQRATLPCLF